jgi:hypothetical protein
MVNGMSNSFVTVWLVQFLIESFAMAALCTIAAVQSAHPLAQKQSLK